MLALLSGVTGTSVPIPAPIEAPVIEERLIEEVKQSPEDFVNTESYIRHYFADLPMLIDVAYCESTFRQHDKYGNVLRGKVNKEDVGVMQINVYYHLEDAESLGYDLLTLEGNTAYARMLYKKQGSVPWRSSSKCWTEQPSSLALSK